MSSFICDAHAHLDELEDIESQIKEAREAKIRYIVGVGMDIDSNKKILEIASMFEDIIIAMGYHPWAIKQESLQQNIDFIRENIDKIQAIGEIGLDYKVKTPKKLQLTVFEQLLNFSKIYDKPVIIHARYSHKRCFELVKFFQIQNAIFHWYSGPLDVLKDIIDSNYFISVTPALAYSTQHKEAAMFAPLENILIETDAPVEYQGKAARLVDVLTTFKLLCDLKALDAETVAHITSHNFKKVFNLTEVPN